MLQSRDPEKLGNKEDPRENTLISLGRESRGDLLGRLGVGGYGNLRDSVRGWVEGNSAER